MHSNKREIVIKMEDVGVKMNGLLHEEQEESTRGNGTRSLRDPRSFPTWNRSGTADQRPLACNSQTEAIRGESEEDEEVDLRARKNAKRTSARLCVDGEENEEAWKEKQKNGTVIRKGDPKECEKGRSKRKTSDVGYEDDHKSQIMNYRTSTSSSEESDEESVAEMEAARLKEELEEKKKFIASLKSRPWRMNRKLKCLKDAQQFVEKFEGYLGKGKGQTLYILKVTMSKKWNKFNRAFKNIMTAFIPWEKRIKEVESHFGASVGSYFIFLRWLYGMNLMLFVLVFGLVVLPEVLLGAPYGTIPRKIVPNSEKDKAMDVAILLEFEGYFKYSPLFYGYYNNQRTVGFLHYRLPLAYFLVGIGTFVYSLIAVVRSIATGSSVASEEAEEREFAFSWILFTSWDFLIGNSEAADSKFAAIITNIKESIVDEEDKKRCENVHARRCLRVLANLITFLCLCGSGYLIYYVVKRSVVFAAMDKDKVTWMEKNELELVVSLLGVAVPPLFEGISEMEEFHPRVALKWQLGRILALFIANLYSLTFALYDEVPLKFEKENAIKNATMWAMKENYGNGTMLSNSSAVAQPALHPADVMQGPCWETGIGIEFMKLTVSNIELAYLTILFSDFLRALLVRYLNYCWCWDLEAGFPSYGEFDISGNVLTILFSQAVIWVGTFFSPGLLGVNMIRLVTSMYIQSWAVMCCNIPHSKPFRISSHFYKVLLFIMLCASIIPVLYAIMVFPPSFDCGPFSEKQKMYDIITETIEKDFSAFWVTFFSYALNPGVVVLVVILMVLVIYYLKIVSKSYQKTNADLRKKLRMRREEEKNQMNNKDSSNHIMKDLEELLPKKPVIQLSTKDSTEGKREMGESLKLSPKNGTMANGADGRFRNAVTRPPGPRMVGHLPGMPRLQIVSPGSARGRGQVIRW
ncbi:transmembrane channel-like protein 2-B [Paramormyrops kingsleyae]|uniref:transmembrane channel-like protein 2-B n=1 Tax=Paramormyrops kingsleyae TaxID=1676925 RepID=UPI003B971958